MTGTAIARPSKVVAKIGSITPELRAHFKALDHARQIFEAGFNRLQSDYVDRIKHAMEGLVDEQSANAETSKPDPVINGTG